MGKVRSIRDQEAEADLKRWAESFSKQELECLECEDVDACLGEDEAEELRLASSVLLSEFSRKSSRCTPNSRAGTRPRRTPAAPQGGQDE